jgi:hypothetical protein
VAFSTTSAPSWYVFCADAYRIPGEASAQVESPARTAPETEHPLPRAAARTRRFRFSRAELQTVVMLLIVVVVSAWYGFHLPPPRR